MAQEAAEKEFYRLESWLAFVVRHVMGAFGSTGLQELDLDRDERGTEL